MASTNHNSFTSSSEPTKKRAPLHLTRFAWRLTLLLLPLALGFGALLLLTLYVGETAPLPVIVRAQEGDEPIVYGPLGLENGFDYKIARTEARQPAVLVLGSSRTLQFRREMFARQPEAFYNAGGAGWTVDQVAELVFALEPSALPEVVIFGVDLIWYNASYERPQLTAAPPDPLENLLQASRALMRGILRGTFSPEQLLERYDVVYESGALGLLGMEESFGYRNDGSLQQGFLIESLDMQAAGRRRSRTAFDAGVEFDVGRPYTRGSELNPVMLARLEEVVAYLHEQGVQVMGFAPPYMPSIYDEMRASGEYTYIPQAVSAIEAMFAAYGYGFYDFTDPSVIGATDSEMYDGWHNTEALSARIVLALTEAHPELLADYVNLDALRARLEAADNPMKLFPTPEPVS